MRQWQWTWLVHVTNQFLNYFKIKELKVDTSFYKTHEVKFVIAVLTSQLYEIETEFWIKFEG